MTKDYYSSSQTIDGWVDTIEAEFSYVKVNNYSEIVKILSIDSDEEIDKIKQALLIIFAKKIGISTFEDACTKLKITPINIDDEFSLAGYKLKIIVEAVNDGWYPNWSDSSENKYVIYFDFKSGFSYCHTFYYYAVTSVPSALCLKTAELAKHCAKIAFKEYKILYSK